jgi:hypothetical protein
MRSRTARRTAPEGPSRSRGGASVYPSGAKGTNEEKGTRVKRRVRPRAAPVVRAEGLSSFDEVLGGADMGPGIGSVRSRSGEETVRSGMGGASSTEELGGI